MWNSCVLCMKRRLSVYNMRCKLFHKILFPGTMNGWNVVHRNVNGTGIGEIFQINYNKKTIVFYGGKTDNFKINKMGQFDYKRTIFTTRFYWTQQIILNILVQYLFCLMQWVWFSESIKYTELEKLVWDLFVLAKQRNN